MAVQVSPATEPVLTAEDGVAGTTTAALAKLPRR